MEADTRDRHEETPLKKLQRRLATIWGGVFVVGFVLVLLLNERLGAAQAQGWGWFSQTFVPTTGIVVSGLIAAEKSRARRMVSKYFGGFTCLALVFYGLVALSTPFISPEDKTLIAWFETSAVWLGIAQATIAGLVTFAFSSSKPEGKEAQTAESGEGGQ